MARAGTKSRMSMVCVASAAAFSKSASVITTNCPFSYSYPLTISAHGTSTFSASQKRR
jgi:hypothetical protein